MQFLVAEAVTAAAWRSPGHSYASNLISDLGYPGEPTTFDGRPIHSPLSAVMNSGFVLLGLLTVAAALLLAPLVAEQRRRWLFLALPVTHLVGLQLLVLFPESPEALSSGAFVFHIVGALLAISAGNLFAALTPRWRDALRLPRWLTRVGVALGVIGLGFLVVFMVPSLANGITERLATYALLAWDVTLGYFLVARRTRTRGR